MKTPNFKYDEAIENLHNILTSNNLQLNKDFIFYGSVLSVSRTGMSRNIEIFTILDNQKRFIGFGKVNGCGMDMLFNTIYNLFEMYKQTKLGLSYSDLRYQENLTYRQF